MRRFLLVGQTGVGKSSFINTTFGVYLAKIADFEACTKIVEHYAYNTPYGDVCLIDTPGFAEINDAQDRVYLNMVRKHINCHGMDVLLYISRLDEARFRPTEKRTLQSITTKLGSSVWGRAWLILTFAASVPKEHLDEVTNKRIEQIGKYIYELTPMFNGFEKIGIGDNVARDWSSNAIPAAKFLTS